ncbi:MAG: prepilin peptidase [Cucumibacter sp.]
MSIANLVILMVFPVTMAFAASSDLMTMRISNRLILLLGLAFCLAAFLMDMPLRDFGIHFAIAIAVLVAGFTLFTFGWVGGGDAKLAAAASLWLGLGHTLPFLIYAALLGGALTLGILALRHLPLPQALVKVSWIDRLHDKKSGVPYGIALAVAGMIVYTDTSIFAHFAS